MNKDLLSGVLLLASASLAILVANSPWHTIYNLFIETPLAIGLGTWSLSKPLLLWINDGLMALFFLMIGLELKKEFLEGELSDPKNIVLPLVGAFGGMLVPGTIYYLFNQSDAAAARGWAIPAATDIAFALGVLAMLGNRVPISMRIFLASLAIFDDMGAIIIIAIFYTEKISVVSLGIVLVCLLILFILNKKGIKTRVPYALVGLLMWHAMLKSGVHATLAGVLLALFIPHSKESHENSLLLKTEHSLGPWVMFVVLPIFAFANSGVRLVGISAEQAFHSVPVGIAAGLFLGKQLGVFSFCWLAIKAGWAKLPNESNWFSLYGVSVLCGIGFTMSLFIGSLAFEATGENRIFDERLGILAGSLLSGLVGYLLLRNLPQKS